MILNSLTGKRLRILHVLLVVNHKLCTFVVIEQRFLLLARQVFLCLINEFVSLVAVQAHVRCLQLVFEEAFAAVLLLLAAVLIVNRIQEAGTSILASDA